MRQPPRKSVVAAAFTTIGARGERRVIGVIAVTAAGRRGAERIAAALPDATVYEGPAAEALPRAFAECDQIVCFLAAGAVVRLIAPLLGTRAASHADSARTAASRGRGAAAKDTDPAVVCVDEARRYAIALL